MKDTAIEVSLGGGRIERVPLSKHLKISITFYIPNIHKIFVFHFASKNDQKGPTVSFDRWDET